MSGRLPVRRRVGSQSAGRKPPKAVGLIAVAAESGLDDTLAAMRRFVALSNPEELPVLSLGGCADKPGDAAADAQLTADARALGRSMAERLGLGTG